MTDAELASFEKQLRLVESVLKVGKLIFGGLMAVSAAIIAVTIWVTNQSSAIAATSKELTDVRMTFTHTITQLNADSAERRKEWEAWRKSVDSTNVRLTTVVEALTKVSDRQQNMMDRLAAAGK